MVTLFMLVLLMKNGHSLYQKLEYYEYYASMEKYYGLSISPNIDFSEEGLQKLDEALVSFFYETNRDSSVLFSVGSQVQLYNEGFITKEELDTIDYVVTVNETYLIEHPIYDLNGSRVQITGEKDENYLLVPIEYQSMEKEIKKYYAENNTFLKYYIDDLKKMGIEAAHAQNHKTIPLNIVYIEDGQFFRISNYIGGKLKGIIKNPMIDVITNDNVSIAQIPSYVTNQDYLIKVDSPSELQTINQILKNTGLDSFVMQFASINNQYLRELKENIIIVVLQFIIIIVLQSFIYMLDKYFYKNVAMKPIIKCFVISWGIAFCMLLFIRVPFSLTLIFSMIVLLVMNFIVLREYIKHK